MKKILLSTALIAGIMATSSAFASISVGNVKVNLPTTSSKTTKTTKTTVKSADAQKLEAQIKALNTKMYNISTNYETAVNNLANNLATGDNLTKYKNELAKMKNKAKSTEIQIDIAEDGTIAIQNSLKSMTKDELKKLAQTKKSSIIGSLDSLKSSANSYTQIASESISLANSIKSNPTAALENAPELITLTKTSKNAAKQAKNITKLSNTIISAFKSAGVKLK